MDFGSSNSKGTSYTCIGVDAHDLFIFAAPVGLTRTGIELHNAIFSNFDLSSWRDGTANTHSNSIKYISAWYFNIEDTNSLLVTFHQNGLNLCCHSDFNQIAVGRWNKHIQVLERSVEEPAMIVLKV